MKKLWKREYDKTKISTKNQTFSTPQNKVYFQFSPFNFQFLIHPYSWIQNAIDDIDNNIDYYQHKSYQKNRSHYHWEVESIESIDYDNADSLPVEDIFHEYRSRQQRREPS